MALQTKSEYSTSFRDDHQEEHDQRVSDALNDFARALSHPDQASVLNGLSWSSSPEAKIDDAVWLHGNKPEAVQARLHIAEAYRYATKDVDDDVREVIAEQVSHMATAALRTEMHRLVDQAFHREHDVHPASTAALAEIAKQQLEIFPEFAQRDYQESLINNGNFTERLSERESYADLIPSLARSNAASLGYQDAYNANDENFPNEHKHLLRERADALLADFSRAASEHFGYEDKTQLVDTESLNANSPLLYQLVQYQQNAHPGDRILLTERLVAESVITDFQNGDPNYDVNTAQESRLILQEMMEWAVRAHSSMEMHTLIRRLDDLPDEAGATYGRQIRELVNDTDAELSEEWKQTMASVDWTAETPPAFLETAAEIMADARSLEFEEHDKLRYAIAESISEYIVYHAYPELAHAPEDHVAELRDAGYHLVNPDGLVGLYSVALHNIRLEIQNTIHDDFREGKSAQEIYEHIGAITAEIDRFQATAGEGLNSEWLREESQFLNRRRGDQLLEDYAQSHAVDHATGADHRLDWQRVMETPESMADFAEYFRSLPPADGNRLAAALAYRPARAEPD